MQWVTSIRCNPFFVSADNPCKDNRTTQLCPTTRRRRLSQLICIPFRISSSVTLRYRDDAIVKQRANVPMFRRVHLVQRRVQ